MSELMTDVDTLDDGALRWAVAEALGYADWVAYVEGAFGLEGLLKLGKGVWESVHRWHPVKNPGHALAALDALYDALGAVWLLRRTPTEYHCDLTWEGHRGYGVDAVLGRAVCKAIVQSGIRVKGDE